MTIHLGDVPASSTLYIPFTTYDANGASVTMTGFATSDILIYKNGSTTQRASTSGFTLLDTDGIDFDGVTGLHGFSVDLSDNTTAGFYAVGSFYWIAVSTITISSQTVTLLPATFRIVAAESTAGKPKVDADLIGGVDALDQIRDSIVSDATRFAGASVAAIKTQTDKLTFTVANQIDANVLDWKSATAPAMTGDAFARLGAPAGASVSADIAAVKVDSAAIKAKTDNLPSDPADASDVAAAIAAIPSANANADALLDRAAGIETNRTVRQGLRLMLAALASKLSGAATTTVTIRDTNDTKDRIVATVDSDGNRSAVTLDAT